MDQDTTDAAWAQMVLENRQLAEEMGFDTSKWPSLDWLKDSRKETDDAKRKD